MGGGEGASPIADTGDADGTFIPVGGVVVTGDADGTSIPVGVAARGDADGTSIPVGVVVTGDADGWAGTCCIKRVAQSVV